MKPSELKNKPPSIMIYGPAGSGKTALVSQAIGGYLFDCDDGMKTAKEMMEKKMDRFNREIEFDTFVDDPSKSPNAYLEVKKKLLDISKRSLKNEWPFDALILDSLTGLARAIQLHVMHLKGGDKFGVPQIQHYGYMVNAVESILTIMRSIPVLRIVTAHEAIIETNDDVLVRIMSVTKPHGVNKIPWLFDEVWHSRIKPKGGNELSYVISGRGTSSIMTRTRSGMTGDVVHDEIGLKGVLQKIGFDYER